MQELLDQIFSHLRGFWRFRWYALAFAWALAVGAWMYVSQVPDQYRATARFHVDTQSLLTPLLRGLAVSPDPQERVRFMTRTLLSRPNLEKVARMTDLDLQVNSEEQMDGLVSRLQNGIQLSGTQKTNLYAISFVHRDRKKAKEVVQSLLTLFVEKSLGQTREDTANAQDFLSGKIGEYEKRLDQAEHRLMEFKRQHTGEMPGQQGDYYQRLQEAMAELEKARFNLGASRSRAEELARQIKGEEPVYGMMGTARGSGAGSPTPELDQRIDRLQNQLDQLLLKYTDNHPEVKSLKATLKELRSQREEARKEVAAASDGKAGPAPLNQNPVYQQLRAALAQARAEVAAARSRVKHYQQQVSALRQKVDTVPKVEAKLAQLNRDYQITKQTYEKLLARQQSAELSESADRSSDRMKFEVIDPPRVPAEPVAPNRPVLLGVGLGGSLAGGAVLGVFLALIWPTFDTRRQLFDGTGIPVIGTVSRVATPGLRMRRLVEISGFLLAVAGLLGAFAAILALETDVFSIGSGHVGEWLHRIRGQL
ncbi:MAG TPA: XrtA system polysaccharide chain length determinant [Gammaproteobacteria bacterium]|nr:XrtA system polysaccharide chain length determinant [Gammaproteobacteria bacterium]